MLCGYSCLCFLFFFCELQYLKKKNLNSRLFFKQAALAFCSPQGAIVCLSWLVIGIGSLSKGIFERRTSTRTEAVSLIICLDATKFLLVSVFILVETILPNIIPLS